MVARPSGRCSVVGQCRRVVDTLLSGGSTASVVVYGRRFEPEAVDLGDVRLYRGRLIIRPWLSFATRAPTARCRRWVSSPPLESRRRHCLGISVFLGPELWRRGSARRYRAQADATARRHGFDTLRALAATPRSGGATRPNAPRRSSVTNSRPVAACPVQQRVRRLAGRHSQCRGDRSTRFTRFHARRRDAVDRSRSSRS